MGFERIFELGDPPEYEPRQASVAARAAEQGVDPAALFYDLLLGRDGRELLLRPLLGYSDYTLERCARCCCTPRACWASATVRTCAPSAMPATRPSCSRTGCDRTRDRIPLETVVHKMTARNADLYGLSDRAGCCRAARRPQRDRPRPPTLRTIVHDLPGGPALVQSAEGYRATIVRGQVTRRDGVDTGARPGRLVRSKA